MNRSPLFAFAPLMMSLVVGLVAAAPVHGELSFGRDMSISVAPELGGNTTHGYAEITAVATNRSTTRSHVITLTAPRNSYGNGDRLHRLTRTVEVAPGATVAIRLFQPPLPMQGSGLAVMVDGQMQEAMLPLPNSHSEPRYGSSTRTMHILLSRSLNRSDLQSSFDKRYPSHSGGSGGYGGSSRSLEADFAQPELPIAEWSDAWLGYSRFDAIMISAEEFRLVENSPVGAALTAYLETGGTLVVLGKLDRPSGTSHVGFGELITIATGFAAWHAQEWDLVHHATQRTNKPWEHIRDPAEANKRFRVADITVPVRGLFVMVLLFAVLIGPVNLSVLARRKRRIWLLWTVPAISLLFCGMVFAYNLITEGWTGHRRATGITLLDQVNRRATTLGIAAFYCPLTPGDGLHYGYDTELTPQVESHFSYGRPRSIDWTRGQHLDSGWITARTPAHLMVRRSALERQRVQFTANPDGSVTALNGLNVDILQLDYADAAGNRYGGTSIKAGEKGQLKRVGVLSVKHQRSRLRDMYAADWYHTLSRATTEDLLNPGTYVAKVNGSPFIEPGLASAEEGPSTSLIVGLLESPAK